MASTQLFFDILARDHASATFNKVGQAAEQLGKRTDKAGKSHQAFGRVVRWAGGMVSAYGVGMFLKSSLQDYAAAELAQVKLENAYKRFPKSADVSISSLRSLNDAMMAKTRFDNDAAAAMQANLMRFDLTAKQVRNLTPLVMDLAEATGTDLVSAGGTFGKALLGNGRALKALGIDYEYTGDRAKDFANIVELLNRKVGGEATKAGKSTAVQMAILGNQYSELKETVGQAVLPAFTKLVDVAGPAISQLGRAVDRNMPQIEQTFEDAWNAAEKFGTVIKTVWDGFSSLPPGVRDSLLLLGGATAALGKLKKSSLGQGIGSIFSAVKGMNVNAGVVNVNGKMAGPAAKNGPGGTTKAGWLAKGGFGSVAVGTLITAAIAAAIAQGIERKYGNTPQGTARRQEDIRAGTLGDGSQRGYQNSQSTTGGIRQPNLPSNAGRWKGEADGIRATRRETDSLGKSLYGVTKNYTDWKGAARSAKFEGVGGAVAVAGAIKKIPDKKSTRLETKGAEESKAKVKGLDGAIGGLKGKRVAVDERGAAASRGRVDDLRGSISGVKGKRVNVEVNQAQATAALAQVTTAMAAVQSKTIYLDVVTRRREGAASGGLIVGPGTATSDSIPAMLSNREFVQPAASVAYYGVGFMEALRTRRLPRPVGFAKGTPPTDKAKQRAKEIEEQVKQARKAAAWQARLAKAADKYNLGDGVLELLGGMDKGAAKTFLPTGKPRSKAAKADRRQLKAMAAKNTAVTRLQERRAAKRDDARDYRDAMREYDNWDEDREFSQMRPDLAIGRAQDKIAAAEKVTWSSKASDKEKAQAYRDRIEWTQKLEEAQQRLNEAQDQQLEKVNQLRDAVDSAAGTYRSFASIATTSVTDVTDAQQKLTDANDAVGAAQKKMDLAGNDRERAAAANELAKALRDQQSAQQAVNTAGKPTSGSIRTNMAAKLQKLRDFSAAVKTLKGQGLNAVTLSELLQMGPEQGYDFAKALLDGGLGDINALQNQITAESASLGYFQYGTDTAASGMTGAAAAQAAGLVANGVVMAPAPVTVSIDGQAIAQALISYQRQNGGSIPGLTS